MKPNTQRSNNEHPSRARQIHIEKCALVQLIYGRRKAIEFICDSPLHVLAHATRSVFQALPTLTPFSQWSVTRHHVDMSLSLSYAARISNKLCCLLDICVRLLIAVPRFQSRRSHARKVLPPEMSGAAMKTQDAFAFLQQWPQLATLLYSAMHLCRSLRQSHRHF